MLTAMTEEDWTVVLRVFEASRSRRGEQAVGKLKRFKRIVLRCEKTARNYGSFIALALGFILIKSVHTA
jgi:hypothetical protein